MLIVILIAVASILACVALELYILGSVIPFIVILIFILIFVRKIRKKDQMSGVIREIDDANVWVSLFRGDEEFCMDIPRSVFEKNGVALREDEGFYFWVNGKEEMVVRSLPFRELSCKDWKLIDQKIAELLK